MGKLKLGLFYGAFGTFDVEHEAWSQRTYLPSPLGGGGKRTSSSITECCPGGWWDSALEFPERTGHARGSFGFSQSLGKDTSISVGRARDVTHAALP